MSTSTLQQGSAPTELWLSVQTVGAGSLLTQIHTLTPCTTLTQLTAHNQQHNTTTHRQHHSIKPGYGCAVCSHTLCPLYLLRMTIICSPIICICCQELTRLLYEKMFLLYKKYFVLTTEDSQQSKACIALFSSSKLQNKKKPYSLTHSSPTVCLTEENTGNSLNLK